MNIKGQIKALKQVLAIVEAAPEAFSSGVYAEPSSLLSHIEMLQVLEDFNIDIEPAGIKTYTIKGNRSYDRYVTFYGDGTLRSIACPDEGKQPNNEWLLRVAFPTGAYLLGDGAFGGETETYPKKTFEEFFAELKTYSPAYCDSCNHVLYFTKDTAKKMIDDYDGIFRKYRGMVQQEVKESRKLALKQELAKLENEEL